MAFGPGTNLVSTCYFKSDPAFRATFEIPGYSVITLVQGLILFVVRHFGQLDLRSFGAFRVTLSCDVMLEFKVI